MTRKEYAVFGWNIAVLNERVTELEKQGHFVRGYEIPKMSAYDYRAADVVEFMEYSPEMLEAWKAKARAAKAEFSGEVQMPEAPRGYGDPTPPLPDLPKPEKTEEASEVTQTAPAPEKPKPVKRARKTRTRQ